MSRAQKTEVLIIRVEPELIVALEKAAKRGSRSEFVRRTLFDRLREVQSHQERREPSRSAEPA